jgi:hypothetical protein
MHALPFTPESSRPALLRRVRTIALSFLSTAALAGALLASGQASAAVTEIPYSGNKNCPAGSNEVRFDPVVAGTKTVGGFSVTLTLDQLPLGPGFDWSATGGTVSSVFVKGGPGGIQFKYAPAANSGENLHSQINPSNGRYYGLSHVSFCYTPGQARIDVQKDCADQIVVGDKVRSINTVTLINNGDFALTNLLVEEVTTSFEQCSLTAVNGVPVAPVTLVPGTKTAVPGVSSLAVGAQATATVECTGLTANIQNTIKAYGTHTTGEIDDSATSDPEHTSACDLPPPKLVVEKDCPADTDVRLIKTDAGLVVQVCPTIKVTNTGTEILDNVTITDALLPGSPFAIGTLAASASQSIRKCYIPTQTEQMTETDGATGQVYDVPSTASFFNTASATGTGRFTKVQAKHDDSASGAECKLCICDGPECE